MTADTRGFVIPIAQSIIIGIVFVTVLLVGYRSPAPDHVRVAVVASPAATQSLQRDLDRSRPGGFVLRAESAVDATAQLRSGTVFGVIEPGPSARLLYAGANGPTVTASLIGTFGALFAKSGTALTSVDLVPAGINDSAGLPLFYMVFGVVLASYLYVISSFSMARDASAACHLLGGLIVAFVLGLAAALIAGYGTGTIDGNVARVAVILGLVSVAVNSTTYLCLRVAGLAGNLLSTVIVIVLGSASGGALAAQYLPAWLGALRPVLPMGVALDGIRRVVYFGDVDPLLCVAVLVGWVVVPQLMAAAVLVACRHKVESSHVLGGGAA